MDINAEITTIKTELAELKTQLLTATEERDLIRQQIITKENQLTELYKHLPKSGKNSQLLNLCQLILSNLICLLFYGFMSSIDEQSVEKVIFLIYLILVI